MCFIYALKLLEWDSVPTKLYETKLKANKTTPTEIGCISSFFLFVNWFQNVTCAFFFKSIYNIYVKHFEVQKLKLIR